MFRETMLFFKPMFRQLKQGTMVPEMKAGLWMILQSIQERNYLAGYDIFMRLAIGAPPAMCCVHGFVGGGPRANACARLERAVSRRCCPPIESGCSPAAHGAWVCTANTALATYWPC